MKSQKILAFVSAIYIAGCSAQFSPPSDEIVQDLIKKKGGSAFLNIMRDVPARCTVAVQEFPINSVEILKKGDVTEKYLPVQVRISGRCGENSKYSAIKDLRIFKNDYGELDVVVVN